MSPVPSGDAGRGAPRLSIVVPVWREQAGIADLVRHLADVTSGCAVETFVVDGGSRAETLGALSRARRRDPALDAAARRIGLRTLRAPRGRGRQLNAGARRARGGILLFLHADTRLPVGAAAVIDAVLSTPGVDAGAFALRFDATRRCYRLFERIVAACGRGPGPWGDQALFVRRAAWRRVGPFAETAILEDAEWVRRARRLGVGIRVARSAVRTSVRRFEAAGPLRQALRNVVVVALWRLGVPADRLARLYARGAPPRGASGPAGAAGAAPAVDAPGGRRVGGVGPQATHASASADRLAAPGNRP